MTVRLSCGRNCSGILHRKLLLTWGGVLRKKARNVVTVCQSWVTSNPTVITIICVHVCHFTFICYVFERWRRTRVTSPQYSEISCNIYLTLYILCICTNCTYIFHLTKSVHLLRIETLFCLSIIDLVYNIQELFQKYWILVYNLTLFLIPVL